MRWRYHKLCTLHYSFILLGEAWHCKNEMSCLVRTQCTNPGLELGSFIISHQADYWIKGSPLWNILYHDIYFQCVQWKLICVGTDGSKPVCVFEVPKFKFWISTWNNLEANFWSWLADIQSFQRSFSVFVQHLSIQRKYVLL